MKRIWGLTTLFCVLAASAVDYRLMNHGGVSLGDGLDFRVTAFPKNWTGESPRRSGYNSVDARLGMVRWDLKKGETVCGIGSTTLLPLADGRAHVRYAVTMKEDFPTEGLVCALSFPAEKLLGGTYFDDRGRTNVFSTVNTNLFVYQGYPKSLSIEIPGLKRTLKFGFDGATSVCIQNDRKWSPTFTMRISLRGGGVLKAGETYERAFILEGEQPTVSYAESYIVKEGPDWIPLDYRKEVVPGSAADFSHLPFRDGPAGKYGWLKNEGGHFVFEGKPGVPQRFWGANFCGEGTCPSHADAHRIIARFQRAGYNTMRIHHYERTLTKGSPDRLAFNPEMLDNFDYFFAQAKAAGIYVTTDLFVSRTINWRDIGIDQDGAVDMSLIKGLFLVHEPAFENWKAFAKNLFTHVNPYTNLRYADDPAMPFISLVNEGVFAWRRGIFDQDATRAKWKTWLAAKRAANPNYEPKAPADCRGGSINNVHAPGYRAFYDFMSDCEAAFAVRARDYLRSIGVKAMLSDWNCGPFPTMGALTNTLDYVDTHFYVDHPSFLGQRWCLPVSMGNSRPDRARNNLPLSIRTVARDARMPFTVSEWNFTAPNAYRGAAGLVTGACAAQLDWDALWRFDYIGRGADLDDGTTGLSYFSVSADPFQVASDRAGVLLFMRRELPVLTGEAAKKYPMDMAMEKGSGRFKVVSAATAGGFAHADDIISAGPLTCRLKDSHATVWASAVDAKPLKDSDRILLSHLTDLKTDGIRFMNADCTVLQSMGSKKLIVRRGSAEIALALSEPAAYEVWALATNGARLENLPTSVSEGCLQFRADVLGSDGKARFLYEIVRK